MVFKDCMHGLVDHPVALQLAEGRAPLGFRLGHSSSCLWMRGWPVCLFEVLYFGASGRESCAKFGIFRALWRWLPLLPLCLPRQDAAGSVLIDCIWACDTLGMLRPLGMPRPVHRRQWRGWFSSTWLVIWCLPIIICCFLGCSVTINTLAQR